jgi:hypothetical protein
MPIRIISNKSVEICRGLSSAMAYLLGDPILPSAGGLAPTLVLDRPFVESVDHEFRVRYTV